MHHIGELNIYIQKSRSEAKRKSHAESSIKFMKKYLFKIIPLFFYSSYFKKLCERRVNSGVLPLKALGDIECFFL